MLLEVDDLRAGYGDLEVLHGVSLRVDNGEFVCLLGPNGAGKTTLLRAISGLVAIQSGEVRLDGATLRGRRAHEMLTLGLGHVPEGRQVWPRMSVAEHIWLGAHQRRDTAAVRQDAEWVLNVFPNLQACWHKPAGFLSGGEQQMLVIARALMGRPHLLLLDEPTLGLSPKAMLDISSHLSAMRDRDLAVLLVEQNASVALRLAQRAYVLARGTVVQEGEHLTLNGDVRRAYLGGLRPEN